MDKKDELTSEMRRDVKVVSYMGQKEGMDEGGSGWFLSEFSFLMKTCLSSVADLVPDFGCRDA